ncbi:hypothetical protein [Pluralibacter gergoviae]|uniref:hypothetical protein n=1 Tax=Pluralibacter gergoviae TaxID=61647 RepID=UPI002ED91EBE
MRNILLSFLLVISLPALASDNPVKERAKISMERFAAIDPVDWYNKGDTTFAENDGFIGVYRHAKVSIRENEVNMKMNYISGPKRPDSDDFSRITTEVCLTVFSQLIRPMPESANTGTWDDDSESTTDTKDDFAFMRESRLDKVHNEVMSGDVDGWKISIKRTVLLTNCSAKKI